MINKISGYNFDITDFDLFKRAEKHVPKELATIINAIAGTFFLSLNSLYFKVLSLPFLLNAQTIHQKGNVSLSQKNAQVILKTALCVIVGLVANKTKALIVAPLGIYIISKKLHFPQRNSNSSRNDGPEDQSASGTSSLVKHSKQPSPGLLSSASSNDGSEDQSPSGTSSLSKHSKQPSQDSLSSAFSDEEDAQEGSSTRQYSFERKKADDTVLKSPGQEPKSSDSSRNDGEADERVASSISFNPGLPNEQSILQSLSSASSDEEDAHEASPTRQYSSKESVDRVPNVLAPAQRSQSSAGTVPAIRLDALRGGAPCQEFQKDPKPTPLSNKPSAGSAPFRQRWKKGKGAGKKPQGLSVNAALNASGAAPK